MMKFNREYPGRENQIMNNIAGILLGLGIIATFVMIICYIIYVIGL